MRAVLRGPAALAAAAALALAACSGNGSATNAPNATQGSAATQAAEICTNTTAATVVSATVGENTWGPVSAKAGDVITWTNSDGVPHRVETDDAACKMDANIPGGGGTKSLIFNAAGTYPFHCSVHPSMKGTITIT